MSEVHYAVDEPTPEQAGKVLPDPVTPPEAPTLPVSPPETLKDDDNSTGSPDIDPRPDTQRRKSTIKHMDATTPESPQLPSRNPRRPSSKRRASVASVQSRYSEMTMGYFESIPAKFNAYAGFFTWILLAGFVLGPSAQQAALKKANPKLQRLLGKAPLLYTSITCSAIGMLGMIFLWIRWRKNYMWLIHKVFMPGALNGLAGTLAVAVNTWAIQIDGIHINRDMIITLAITGGSTVVCLLLTLIYQLALLSVKREHRRLVREADIETPAPKGTAEQHDFTDAKDSIWSAITN